MSPGIRGHPGSSLHSSQCPGYKVLGMVTVLDQVGGGHEEIIQHLVKETDLGKVLDRAVEKLKEQ
jgi:hypothetical protein